jgi:hypothetical protein
MPGGGAPLAAALPRGATPSRPPSRAARIAARISPASPLATAASRAAVRRSRDSFSASACGVSMLGLARPSSLALSSPPPPPPAAAAAAAAAAFALPPRFAARFAFARSATMRVSGS